MRALPHPVGPLTRQRGQALVLTAAFGFVLAAMVLFLFGTAQLANQKTKLQNTADAAAYSGAVLQARDYNFSAYTNRAMVANHVAMAQFVGLNSWTEEVQKEFKADPLIPGASKTFFVDIAVLGSVWSTPAGLAATAANTARRVFDTEKHLATGIEPLIVALQKAQVLYHAATLTQFATGAVVDGVVKANDPNASLSRAAFNDAVVVSQVVNWKAYTKTQSTTAEMKRFADVTVDSAALDGFSHQRNMVRVTPSLPYSPVEEWICPGADISDVTMGMTHGGGTQLSTDMKRWMAIDSAGVTGAWGCAWIYGIVDFGFVLPVTSVYMDLNAHGGGVAGRTGSYAWNGYSTPSTSSWGYGQALGALTDPVTAPPGLIRYAEGPGSGSNVAPSYGGIREYQDVAAYAKKPATQVDALNVAPTLSVEVQKAKADIHTAAQLMPGSTTLKLDDGLKGNVMRTVASGQAYFMRPQHADHRKLLNASWLRDDNKTEYASLYSPYWQARLVDTPRANVELSTASQ